MRHRLVCRQEQELPVAVVHLSGTLDAVTAPAVTSALQRCLVAQPDALIADVADLSVADAESPTVFATLARDAATWPGVPLVLCGSAAIAGVPGYPDRAAALHAVARRRVSRPSRTRLLPVPPACRQARGFVQQSCARWRLGSLAAGAALVVTELVANVVRHAKTGMELSVSHREGRLTVAVRDRCASLPQARDSGLADPGGRGLRLVDELAQEWGVVPSADGKVVWASFAA